MQATFVRREPVNDTITTFWFESERPMHYTAGQFTELTIDHPSPDDRGTRRWFTLSSSPNTGLVSITTRFAGDKSSSFKRALFALESGSSVLLEDAMGDFVLPKLVQTPVICIAGGIGITPFHSMFEWLAETNESRNIHLFYAVRNEDDIIFQDAMQAAGVHATIVVDQPSAAWGGVQGKITAEMILGIDKPNDETLFYLSGPEAMLEALKKELLAAGVARHQLVTDFFPGYSKI